VSAKPLATLFFIGTQRILPRMAPQPQAAVSRPQPKAAATTRRASERRWPLFWTVFGALAASAVLWVLMYFAASSAIGLIGGILSGR
jgi:hypothetical protein